MDNYIVAGAIIFIIFILLIYIYIKDAETSKKFYLYERAIEDLNKKLYEIEKKIDLKSKESNNTEEIKEYIDEIIEKNLEKLTDFAISLKKEQKDTIDEIYKKIEYIDEKVKNFAMMPDGFESNEKKIISLYHKGLSISEIARNLRLGIGEVELVLKIAGIK